MAESKNVTITYLGPAHMLEHDGKVYRPGDKITLPEKEAARLARTGHAMDGYRLPSPDEFTAGGVQGNSEQRKATQEVAERDAEKMAAPPGTPPDEALVAEAKEARRELQQQEREKKG